MRMIACALLLLLPGADEFQGTGVVKGDVFVADDGKKELKIGKGDWKEGDRLWIRGSEKGGSVDVKECEKLPKEGAASIPSLAECPAFSAAFDQVYPWCDHMPMMEPGERRQYMILSVTLENLGKEKLEVEIVRSFLSFDENAEGTQTQGVSVREKSGMGSGTTKLELAPGETRSLDLRGDNLYPEGNHGKKLYVTLVLAAGKDRVLIRSSGIVEKTS